MLKVYDTGHEQNDWNLQQVIDPNFSGLVNHFRSFLFTSKILHATLVYVFIIKSLYDHFSVHLLSDVIAQIVLLAGWRIWTRCQDQEAVPNGMFNSSIYITICSRFVLIVSIENQKNSEVGFSLQDGVNQFKVCCLQFSMLGDNQLGQR